MFDRALRERQHSSSHRLENGHPITRSTGWKRQHWIRLFHSCLDGSLNTVNGIEAKTPQSPHSHQANMGYSADCYGNRGFGDTHSVKFNLNLIGTRFFTSLARASPCRAKGQMTWRCITTGVDNFIGLPSGKIYPAILYIYALCKIWHSLPLSHHPSPKLYGNIPRGGGAKGLKSSITNLAPRFSFLFFNCIHCFISTLPLSVCHMKSNKTDQTMNIW